MLWLLPHDCKKMKYIVDISNVSLMSCKASAAVSYKAVWLFGSESEPSLALGRD